MTMTEQMVWEQVGLSGQFVGGCRVGNVLQTEFCVKGVNGLRVVHTLALAEIPTSSGPMASVYTIAEYAAEMLAKGLQ